jgi:hypothetical protein
MLRTKYSEEIEKQMKTFYNTLNEKDRRRYAAIEAMKLGHGRQNYISSVLGCHFQTVMAGINEITNGLKIPDDRIRNPGGGKKKIINTVENVDEVLFQSNTPLACCGDEKLPLQPLLNDCFIFLTTFIL